MPSLTIGERNRMPFSRPRIPLAILSLVTLALLATGCTSPAPDKIDPPELTTDPPRVTATTAPGPQALPQSERGQFTPAGAPQAVSSGLDAPWSIAELADGSLLISERDTGLIKEIRSDGSAGAIATVPGVRPGGEGGLLGIAVREATEGRTLYAYLTTATDNRILRMPLGGSAGAFTLGPAAELLTGIPRATNHNGGRIAFGPDGMLYATTGDAGQPGTAQDPTSLGGKILRMTPDGAAPADNPISGSRTYSYGHRNPQGIAWDSAGTLWASEFGQNTWDELNRIQAGGNYGWPVVEGIGRDARFIDPAHQWSTAEASPSGLAIRGETAFVAGLGGRRLWAVDLTAPQNATSHFAGTIGRIRDTHVTRDGSLLLLSNNTDGRGNPSAQDDVLYRTGLSSR